MVKCQNVQGKHGIFLSSSFYFFWQLIRRYYIVISTLYHLSVWSGPMSAYKINGDYRIYGRTGTFQSLSRWDCADDQVDLVLRYSNAIRAHHYTRYLLSLYQRSVFWVNNSADNTLKYFPYFPQKIWNWTLNANCLLDWILFSGLVGGE